MATKKKPVCKFTRTKLASKRCKKMKNGTWLCCPTKKAVKKTRKKARKARR